jgi:hypothetical protein
LIIRAKIRAYISIFIFIIMLITTLKTISAEEATSIEISVELSISECYSGDALWVNGTALYDNSTQAEDSEVLIQIKENAMEWKTTTDSNGIYEKQINAVGRFIDQSQQDVIEYTDWIQSGIRVGQSFKPNASEIQSIDLYFIKVFPSPSSSITVYINTSINEPTAIGSATLEYKDIQDGWNNFAFSPPLEVIPDNEYFILLTSNTTVGSYLNQGRPWGGGINYENGSIYWDYGTIMVIDPEQDIGFKTYFDEELPPGDYTVNVTVTGANSTSALYGYNKTLLKVKPDPIADLEISNENISLIYSNEPPLEGDLIVLNATIQNQGDKAAPNFLVNFSFDLETNIFDSQVVTLEEFQEDNISATWTAEPGNHTLFITLDPSSIINESNETNNYASLQIFVDGDNDRDGIGNLTDDDDDNDGYPDTMELGEGTDPLNTTSRPPDNDGDFTPDSMDLDDDNDGWIDVIETAAGTDPFDNASQPHDLDEDGIADELESDIDEDGVPNEEDVFPYDSTEWLDTDADTIGNNADIDDDNDGFLDEEDIFPLDTDNDGLDNDYDWDDDSDGIADYEDDHPLDTDNDGLRNDIDDDDDDDGLTDSEEEKKNTNPLKWDTDGDEVSDKRDYDPLDSGVTTKPEFPMIYLIVPLIAILILILIAFLASRMGAAAMAEGYQELPTLEDKYRAPSKPEAALPPPVEFVKTKPTDELAGLEEEIEEIQPPPKDELEGLEEEHEDELAGLEEEIEGPPPSPPKDELDGIEEEFEDPRSPPSKEKLKEPKEDFEGEQPKKIKPSDIEPDEEPPHTED